jgi:putative ABC transport system substrate-binding protein
MKIGRREFVVGIVGVAAWPLCSLAQQGGGLRRVMVMTNVAETDQDEQARVGAFRQELAQLGWIEGKNIRLDYRWTVASLELAEKTAAEIVSLKPDVILVIGTTTVSTLLKHTRTIPVVFVTGADPVKVGFVKSLGKPGGNATGFVDFQDAIGAKWLQILKEISPSITRAIVLHTDSRASLIQIPALQQGATAFGIELLPANVQDAAEIERVFEAHAGATRLGVVVPPSSIAAVHRTLIVAQVARHGFPAIYANRRYPADGGLMSYGTDRVEQYRRSAAYVDRILKGAMPDDLPVRQQEKSEFVLNLKTAKALGLNVPRIMLLRADEVIE